jgi:hypothetical protein
MRNAIAASPRAKMYQQDDQWLGDTEAPQLVANAPTRALDLEEADCRDFSQTQE